MTASIRPDHGKFTRRDRAILLGLARGLRMTEIAQHEGPKHGVHPDRIREGATRTYRKLGVRTQAGAVIQAIRIGLLPCPCAQHSHPIPPRPHPSQRGTRHA